MTNYPFVEVHWLDAQSTSNWVAPENFPTPMPVVSRGWLVVDDGGYITLAASMHESEFGEVITIPRGMIEDLQKLRVAKASK